MQDLLEITHFLTRVKVAPGARKASSTAAPARPSARRNWRPNSRSPSLTRAWQMLLKGLFEVRDATRPISACEMALIRLAYAADLPPTDKLVRDLLDGDGAAGHGRAGQSAARCHAFFARAVVSQTVRALPGSAPASA